MTKSGEEFVLSLSAGINLRGQVLRADGLPAADVEIRLHVSGSLERIRIPDPFNTDWDGRFEVKLRPGGLYTVEARVGRERARTIVSTFTLEDKDVVVRFPGAQSIRGFLLDPDGNPVAGGEVQLWETFDEESLTNETNPLTTSTKTKQDGSYRIDLTRNGEYRILGTVMGLANTLLTEVEITDLHPHANATLRLLPAKSIAGTVRHENGAPITGARMFLSAEKGENHFFTNRPKRRDLYGRVEPVITADDGSFMFLAVHPNTTYMLTCRPYREKEFLRTRQRGVAPGNQDVRMVLTESEIMGSSISGTVVADDSGEPIPKFTIKFLYYRADGTIRATSGSNAEIEPGRYTLPGLSLGEVYGFVVSSKSHALKVVGPLTTTRDAHIVNVRLGSFGKVECRVIDKKGLPIADALVMIIPVVPIPGAGWRNPSPTNASGLRPFSKLSPGKYEIYPIRDQQKLESKIVEVFPGKTTKVELRIAR